MVTKAELEKQVAELKRQLAAQEQAAPTQKAEHDSEVRYQRFSDQLHEWSAELENVLEELEHMPQKKPVLFALGIFALGYLIGRSR